MSPTIINHEQSEYWNKKYGHKWVDNDNSMNERLTILTKALFLKTNIEKGDKVLDIGCGGGQTSFEASQLVGENGYVLGADISNLLLDLAKSKYSKIKNLDFKNCDAENFDFKKNNFNKVISRFGVMFFKNPIHAFQNINKSIKNGGSLNFVCWTNMMENEFHTAATNIILRHINKEYPKLTRDPGPFAFNDKEYIQEILNNSGFKNIKVEETYTSISTQDTVKKDAELLLNLGMGARLLAEEDLSDDKLLSIKKEIEAMSEKRQKNGEISYKACLNYVSATK